MHTPQAERPATLLQALMTQRRWTREWTLRELEQRAWRMKERRFALSLRQLDRWLVGDVGIPRSGTCRVVEEEFGHPIAVLLAPPSDDAGAGEHVSAREELLGAAHPAVRGTLSDGAALPAAAFEPSRRLRYGSQLPLGGPSDATERLVIMGSAYDAGRQADQAAAGDISPGTVEQLHDHVVELSIGYLSGPMMPMWLELRALRGRTFELLDRTERLQQRHDLYLLAGMVSCLLAGTSCDLGYPAAAVEWARAAATYGELIGHDSLRAYATGQLAMFAYLQGNPRRALRHARDAQRWATGGSAMVRLRGLEALACSRLDDVDGTTAALVAGERARDRASAADDLHDQTPGMFTSTAAKQAYMASMALTNLGDYERAAREAQRTIDLYTSGPAEKTAQGAVNVARIDLATAHLARRRLDAAAGALAPVLVVPPDERTTIIVARIGGVHDRLGAREFDHSREAVQLAEAIEAFRAGAAVHQLPGR
jgi:hypothetical protein